MAITTAGETAADLAAAPVAAAQTNRSPESESIYRVVWRWHFYAGLLLAPIILTATLTGALYVFKTELADWLYSDLYFVEPTGQRLTYAEQQKLAVAAVGDLDFEGMLLVPEANRSTQFVAHIHPGGDENAAQQHLAVFVDPYAGKVLGTQVLETNFFGIVLNIHRTLLAGTTGRIVVELATCWALILIVTGLYLWWPRKNPNRGVWLPKLTGKPYAVLRDWHAVSGAYVSVFALLIAATGVFFTLIWGTGYFMAGQALGQVPAALFGPVESQQPVGKMVPVPPAAGPGMMPTFWRAAYYASAAPVSMDHVVSEVYQNARPGDRVLLQTAHSAVGAHRAFIFYDEDKLQGRVQVIDQYTGQTMSYTRLADMPPMFYARVLAVSIHMGKIFGLTSKLLALATCLVLAGMVVTGLSMWWLRRPGAFRAAPPTCGSAGSCGP